MGVSWVMRWRVVVVAVVLAVCALVGWKVARWPDVAAVATTNPASTAFFDRAVARAKAAGQPVPRRRVVAWSAISVHAKHAVVVAEDIDFFSHRGFAWGEVEQAVRDAIDEGRPLRGASTLTQQLAKNLWLSPSRNPLRKLDEVVLTVQLERRCSKRRILELYLNAAEFGPGVWGIETAARHYFGVAAKDLSRQQAAALAAGLSRPSTWHPGVESAGYRKRVARLVRRMEATDWVAREVKAAGG